MSNETGSISGTIEASTDDAVLFSDGDMQSWLPRSLVEGLEPPIIEGEEVDLEIPEWLADREGL